MILGGIAGAIKGQIEGLTSKKIHGKIVLVKKNVLDFNDFNASIVDRLSEVFGQGVSLQLISATVPDPKRGNRGVLSKEANVENWISTLSPIAPGDSTYTVTFDWDEKHGVPGAFIIKNHHQFEFLLKTVTLENVPVKGSVHFVCNSWVYNTSKYNYDRVFFANETYVTSEVPKPLEAYVKDELLHLRGEGVTGELKEWDRVYDYATYNDLGNPDADKKLARPVLGGSAELPYPRRGKTGRGPSKTDPNSEKRMFLSNIRLDIYVPRDERFGHLKMSDFLGYALKALVQSFVPALEAVCDFTPMEFDTFQDVLNLYEGGLKLPNIPAVDALKDMIPFELLKELVRSDGERVLKFPLPLIIQVDKEAWRTDEEFGREMVAGVNPVIIRRLRQFPPTSKLDPTKYGDQTSTITAQDIEKNMGGVSVGEALETNRLYILDHHDSLIPYLNRINSTSNKIYATRTIVFTKDDGTLKPLAIELSLPHPDGEQHGVVSKVFTPADQGVEGSIWQLAKAYAAVNDSGVHQLISHWLNTHAVIEPFVIATNRQLSVVHPIHKLLSPHYRDTMNINALARQTLICAGGLLEKTVFPGPYAMQMSAVIYKNWNFLDQALPQDLLIRGVAVEDSSQPSGVRLLIQDYPYAVDGLQIWSAIKTWVAEFVSIYYRDDAAIRSDTALQAWWAEVRDVGHGDRKDEPWWPTMTCTSDLISSCTTIIWVASALHAAVNFGQYPYAGYIPNRPTVSRRFMPEPGTKEYAELEKNPDKVFLGTITSQLQTIIGVSLIEILSRHASDEVYLGQRASPEWTTDKAALAAFERFGKRLEEIEKDILANNSNASLKNRNGPAKAPYTLLYPNTSDTSGIGGLTGKGIPNSISI